MKTLRSYQEQALTDLFQQLFTREGNPLLVLPVGSGKSLCIAEIIKRLQGWYPNLRIIMLVHTKELLKQNQEELFEQYLNCDFGFYCAGLNQKKLHNDITFASIQSIAKKVDCLPRVPHILIVDECHLIPHKTDTQYRKFIDGCLALNPKLKVIGMTGTKFRADTGMLTEGENKLFDYVAHEIPMTYMIEEGWWAKPVSPKTAYQMDTTGVGMRAGDFIESQLQEAVNKPEITDTCIKELMEVGKDRKRWLVFTAGIQHAEDVCSAMNNAGIPTRCLHSGMDKDEADQNLKDHKAGLFTALINVAALTTGYNDPNIDLLAILRPMRSPVLYTQVVGRGVRPVYADGYDLSTREGRLEAIANGPKPDILIVDFGGVVDALGPVDQIDIRKKYSGEKEKGEGEEGGGVFKICPNCGTECAAAQRYCYNCSYSFIQLTDKAGSAAIISTDVEPEWFDVFDMQCEIHTKEGSYPSMKVSYYTMSGIMREWVCVEHHNYEQGDPKRFAWNKAVEWHKKRSEEPCPTSATDAVNFGYKTPVRVLAKKDGKYWRIMDYEFDDREEPVQTQHNYEDDFIIPF